MINKISYGDMVRAENVTIGNIELHNTLDKKTIEDFNRPLENLFYNDQEMLQIFENFTKNLYSDDVILQNSSYSNFEMTLADDIFILNNICYIRLTPGIVLRNSSDANGKIIINYPNIAVAQRQLEDALDLNTTFGAEGVEIKYIPELDIFKARIKRGAINNPFYTYYTNNSNALSEWNDDTNVTYGYKSGVRLLNAILLDNSGAFIIADIKLETFVTNTSTYTTGTFYWVLNSSNEFILKINTLPTENEFELNRFVATFNAGAGTLTPISTTQANTTFFNNANIVTDDIVNIETTTTDTVTLKNSAGSIIIDSDGNANFSDNLVITGDINSVVDINATGNINGLSLSELATGFSVEGGTSSSKTLTVDETKSLSDKQDNLAFGIANTNTVVINSADVADNDYAKFTASGLEGRSYTEVREDLGLSITDEVVFGKVTASNADFGDIKIDNTNNVIENTATDTNLIIKANGNGIISIPDNPLTVTNGITADLTGNADTATALESSFSVTFATGDVTGSFTTDGSSNVSNVNLTIEPDSVALSTQTTGNYVQQGTTSGNGISGSVNSEGGTFTVTSNATSVNSASTIVFRDSSGSFAAEDITASEITTSVLDSNSAATWSLVDNNANALNIKSNLLKIDTTNDAEGISTNGYLTAINDITTSGDIKINGSTSGTIVLSAPDVAGTTAISFPATSGTVITSGDSKTVTNSMIADDDLTAIAGISATSGFLKKTAANTWSLDTNTYLTENQTITLSGDVSGSGTTSIDVVVENDSHTHGADNLTGTTLASSIVTSSLTTVGTIGAGVWQGTAIADSYIASASSWNALVSNVTTNLSTTHNASTVVINSSDGTNATINAANASTAGIMSEAMYDQHILNNAKVSNATHTGEVTGSTALTIASNVVDADNLKVTGNGSTSQYLRSDGDGTFTWATPSYTTSLAWGSITGTPTTVSGYGITDAMTTSHVANAITSTNISNWGTAYTNTHTSGSDNQTITKGSGMNFTSGSGNVTITLGTPETVTTATTNTVSTNGHTHALTLPATMPPSSHTHTFASLTSKPTTISGYGITDAMTTSHDANDITSTNISNWGTAYSNTHISASDNQTITSGNGMNFTTGSENVTITLGTPETVTTATTNTVSTNGHTHALTLPSTMAPSNHNLIDTTKHPVSGLTTGHFLKATGATTYGFAAHGLTYTDVGASSDSHTHALTNLGIVSGTFTIASGSSSSPAVSVTGLTTGSKVVVTATKNTAGYVGEIYITKAADSFTCYITGSTSTDVDFDYIAIL